MSLFTGLSRTWRPAPCNCVIYGVVRVQFGQLALKGIDIRSRELGFAEAADGVEDIQCPAALGDGNIF